MAEPERREPLGVLVVDHLYLCVDRERREVQRLRQLGFVSGFGRVHEGQGTSNDLVLFASNYFELLFMHDEAQAQANPLRLNRRFAHTQTRASPFGVALRGDRSALAVDDWMPYQLAGMRSPLHVVRATLADDRLPMVFCFDSDAPLDGGPRNWGVDDELFAHRCGATGLAPTRLAGPGYGALASWGLPERLSFEDAPRPHMELGVEGVDFGGESINGQLTLR